MKVQLDSFQPKRSWQLQCKPAMQTAGVCAAMQWSGAELLRRIKRGPPIVEGGRLISVLGAAALLGGLVPSGGTKVVGYYDDSLNTVKFGGNWSMRTTLFYVDDHG